MYIQTASFFYLTLLISENLLSLPHCNEWFGAQGAIHML